MNKLQLMKHELEAIPRVEENVTKHIFTKGKNEGYTAAIEDVVEWISKECPYVQNGHELSRMIKSKFGDEG